ncbi:MAG: OmpA family protein [Verrucomicrobia bacterium]|nr:OmpA family protein [Verrucomicrobiota bacterium]
MKKLVVFGGGLVLVPAGCANTRKPEYAGAGMPKLQQVISFMKQERKNVILASFTNERGTEGYNRALGERRAQATRDALIGLGALPARIQTVSFGLEMPADPGHNEAAWAKNRRVETGRLVR